MRILILLALSLLIYSCEEPKKTYEIAISDVLHKTSFRAKNCTSDYYYNILIKNDTLFIDGKINNEYGNYTGALTDNESKHLSDLINNVNPKTRTEKEINPTTGLTALLIKKNGETVDSLVDFKTKWGPNDLKLFNYIGELICVKSVKKINESINYPTWEMVKPTK